MRTILITGAAGFIGSYISQYFSGTYRIVAIDKKLLSDIAYENYIPIRGDISDTSFLKFVCDKYIPDIIIHCAGISNQKLFFTSLKNLYKGINAFATENLAKAAVSANPDVYFIFLSSVSVYGKGQINKQIKETDIVNPTSDYAKSKMNAENLLKKLYDQHRIPVLPLRVLVNLSGYFLRNKSAWIHSCSDKLTKDYVLDNTKMLNTGFKPVNWGRATLTCCY